MILIRGEIRVYPIGPITEGQADRVCEALEAHFKQGLQLALNTVIKITGVELTMEVDI